MVLFLCIWSAGGVILYVLCNDKIHTGAPTWRNLIFLMVCGPFISMIGCIVCICRFIGMIANMIASWVNGQSHLDGLKKSQRKTVEKAMEKFRRIKNHVLENTDEGQRED